MSDRDFIVIGGGGHAGVVISLLQSSGYSLRGFLDPDPAKWSTPILGVPCLGGDDVLGMARADGPRLAIGGGLSSLRRRLFKAWRDRGYEIPALVHPAAVVDPSASVADGAQIMAGTIVQVSVAVGTNVLLNTGCRIDHDCRLDDHVSVGPGAVLCGGVTVGRGAEVGANATILPSVAIEADAEIGAGAVVLANVDKGTRVAGVPARKV